MFRRAIPACVVILTACSSATSSPATSHSPTVASSVASTDNAKVDSLTRCQTARDTAPKQVEYDSWDAPGVITTDIEIDHQGNKIISGYLSDEQDFNYKDSFSTVGVDGWGFQFIAKFNPQSEFEWIRCLRESSLNHWYKGPVVDTDASGFIYVCDSTLERWTTTGELVWASETLRWDSENSSDTTHNCATSSDGFTVVTGVDETYFVAPNGTKLWGKDFGWNSVATFLANGNIALASNSSLTVIDRQGNLKWQHSRNQRNDIGPDGLIDGGTNAYPTDQTGLSVDDTGILIATSLNKKADFDGSENVKNIRPRWIQEAVVARYSYTGQLKWATKIQPPSTGPNKNETQYFEVFDSLKGTSGDVFVYGGGTNSRETQPLRLFVAKFSPSGKQLRFMWLEEFTGFIHNMGRYIDVDSRGRLYGAGEGLKVPPFIWSRDL